jgi:tetratricopeptide (TPR) repeat protein
LAHGTLFPDLPEIDSAIAQPTAEDYARAARFALERKALPRAVEQVSAALAFAPLDPEHLRLLDAILSASRAPLELVRLREEGTFFGLVAVRARVLARARRWAEALEALSEAVLFQLGTPYLCWTRSWLDHQDAVQRLPPDGVAALLVRIGDGLRRHARLPGTHENVDAALVLAARVAEAHPKHAGLGAARSRMLRARGDLEAAARVLEAHSTSSDIPWEIAVELSALARDRGEPGARRRWLERALDARPDDAATRLDLADTLLEAGEIAAALEAYDAALALGPSAHARAARAYARWSLLDDPSLFDRAESLDASRAHFQGDALGYETVLLDPLDPLVPVVRRTLQRAPALPEDRPVRVRVRMDRPAAPSALLAFRLGLDALGRTGELEIEHPGGAPRVGVLKRAQAALARDEPAAARACRDAIAAGAVTPFSWARARADAEALARFSAPPFDDLLALLVRPPELPPRMDAVEWLLRVQTLVALAIAQHRASWPERHRTLQELLAGSDDWVCVAGVLGLAAAAEREPELRGQVTRELGALVPGPASDLPLHARAVAIAGSRLAGREDGGAFVALRGRALLRAFVP